MDGEVINLVEDELEEPLIIYNDVSEQNGVRREGIVENSSSTPKDVAGPSTAAVGVGEGEHLSQTDDDNVCSICFEPYTTTGVHRVTCLKCGHLFGKRCIERWFQQNIPDTNKNRGTCPTCKQKARKADIREHFCRGLKVIDTSERDEAMRERDREREEKKKLQIELATVRQQKENEIRRLQDELRELQERVANSNARSSESAADSSFLPTLGRQQQRATTTIGLRLEPLQKIEICKDNDARVMDHMGSLAMLVASSKSSTTLFPGYGLTKVHTGLLRCSKFVRIHSQPIRDVKFTPSQDALILTGSQDKSLKITSVHSDGLVHGWNVGQPVWSCCWRTGETNYIFAGTQNGKVKLYDTRMPVLASIDHDAADQSASPVDTFDCGNMGIIGMQWVDMVSNINARGLLVSTIDRLIFLENVTPTEFRPHILALENKITSTSYHMETQHFLTTCGPSARRERTEHMFKELTYRSEPQPEYSCNPIRSFYGGHQQLFMCRNAVFSHPQCNALMAVVFDEHNDKLQIWDASSGNHVADAPKSFGGQFGHMRQLAEYTFDQTQIVAGLGERFLHLYKTCVD